MKTFDQIEKNNGSQTLYQVAQEVGIIQNRAQFIPGRFYYLRVVSPTPNLSEDVIYELTDGQKYIDLNPIGLCLFHENFKEVALILNLKVIPPQVSAKLLETYYYLASRYGLNNLYKGDKLIPLNERRLLDQRFYMLNTSILSQATGVDNLNFAINKYNIEHIAEARLIDWDQFGKLIRPKFSQFGLFPDTINMESLYEEFMINSIK